MKIIVTGGGTSAPIDDVRAITNGSTGQFAAGITEALIGLREDTEVWHLAPGNAAWPYVRRAQFDLNSTDPYGEFTRLRELHAEWKRVRRRLHFVPLDPPTVPHYWEILHQQLETESPEVVILAIAASDYAPEPTEGKIRSEGKELTVVFKPLPKVISEVRDWAPRAYLVGFKLLSGSSQEALVEAARASCERNRLDLVVANDWQTVRAGRHTIHLVRPRGEVETLEPESNPPRRLAERILAWSSTRKSGQ
jgi:phosphopantothenate-cysteine ligase